MKPQYPTLRNGDTVQIGKKKKSQYIWQHYISMDLKDLYRTFHQTAAEHTCLRAHKIFSRINHFGEQSFGKFKANESHRVYFMSTMEWN